MEIMTIMTTYNEKIRAGVISDAGGGAETRFQLTVA